MSNPGLTSNLVNAVTRAVQSSLNGNMSESDVIDLLNEELLGTVVSAITSVREGYWWMYKDYTFLSGTTNTYQIPARAIAAGVDQVLSLDANGNVTRRFVYLEPSELNINSYGLYDGFRFQDDKIQVVNSANLSSSTLRITYNGSPNLLALETTCPAITAINTSTKTIYVATTAYVTALLATGTTFDFICKDSPAPARSVDNAVVSNSTNTMTFSTLPTDLAVGDYICPAGTTPIAQIPKEAVPYLISCVAYRWLSSVGIGPERIQYEQVRRNELKANLVKVLTPRAVNTNRKVMGNTYNVGSRRVLAARRFSRGF